MKINLSYTEVFKELFVNSFIFLCGIPTDITNTGGDKLLKMLEQEYNENDIIFKLKASVVPNTDDLRIQQTTHLAFNLEDSDIPKDLKNVYLIGKRPEAILLFWKLRMPARTRNKIFFVFDSVKVVDAPIIKIIGIDEIMGGV